MKTLVVYFSRDGNTKKVAEKLAEKLEADIEAITEPTSRSGAMGWIRSGAESARGVIPEINPVKADVSGYDLVVVGSPIWASSVSSPVRAFLLKHGEEIKETAFFLTMNGERPEKALSEMQERTGKQPQATAGFKAKAIKDDSYLPELDAFAEKLG